MRSGDPPARKYQRRLLHLERIILTYVDLRIPYHRYLMLLSKTPIYDAREVRLTLVVERNPLWLSRAFDIFKGSSAAVGVDTCQDDAVCPEILSNALVWLI